MPAMGMRPVLRRHLKIDWDGRLVHLRGMDAWSVRKSVRVLGDGEYPVKTWRAGLAFHTRGTASVPERSLAVILKRVLSGRSSLFARAKVKRLLDSMLANFGAGC